MENIETQTSLKIQSYVEVLKHGYGQWVAYLCPSKPKLGVQVGHDSQRLWDVSSIALFFIFNFLNEYVFEDLLIIF